MLEYLQGRLFVPLEGLGVDALGLDSLHQGLGHRVVLAAAGAAHGTPAHGAAQPSMCLRLRGLCARPGGRQIRQRDGRGLGDDQ